MRHRGLAVAVVLAAIVAPAAPAAAADREVVFVSNRAGEQGNELYVVDRGGDGLRRLTFNDLRERQPVWSRDGTRIAFAGLADGNWDIYTVDASGGDLRRLTTDPARDDYPRYTADGRITFQRGPFECPCAAWVMDTDGSNATKIPIDGNVLTPEPSTHGRRLAFASNRDGRFSIYIAQLNGEGERRITDGPAAFGDFHPRWSPNGNNLVFLRDLNGIDNDVFVVHSDGTELRRLTATPDRVEFWPSWSSGDEIVVTAAHPDGRQRLLAVSIDGQEAELSTSPRAPLGDDFEDGIRDASMWHAIQDPGGSIVETGGRLVASISADAVPGGPWNQVDEHYGSQCSLPGDYDYEVDYSLVTWPANGGFFAQLSAFFGDASLARMSSPWQAPYDEQYGAAIAGTFGVINTTDTSGTLRLVRAGGETSAYVRSGGDEWTLVHSAPGASGNSVYGMGLWAPAATFAHQDGRVAYDNFRLDSGVLNCPSWWNDFGADVGVSRR